MGDLIEGEATGSKRRPTHRRRRFILWLLETNAGLGVISAVGVVLIGWPIFYLGAWWLAIIISVGLGFAWGWNAARKSLLKDGWIDRI